MDSKKSFPAIAHFAETGEALREAMGEMAQALYKNPKAYGLRDDDDVGELFVRYPGRLEAILRKYQEASEYYPAYLIATVRYLALSLRRERARAYDRQAVFDEDAILCSEDTCEVEYGEECPASPFPEAYGGKGRFRQGALQSRFVYLSLKCAWTVDEDALARAASSLGVDPVELSKRLADTRARTWMLRDRWEFHRAARDASWVRLRILERRLAREEDPHAKELYREQITRERARFRKRLNEVRKTRLTVSNKAVAEVLSISKGTVDAGLYHVARRVRDFQSREENR